MNSRNNFKIGDTVIIRKDATPGDYDTVYMTRWMAEQAGRKFTITGKFAIQDRGNAYAYKLDDNAGYTWTPSMFEQKIRKEISDEEKDKMIDSSCVFLEMIIGDNI